MQLENADFSKKLTAADTDIVIDKGALKFETTAEIEPLDEMIGQDKAISAIEIGLGIEQKGYNIYVSGLDGTGRKETVRHTLEKRLKNSSVPNDWIYVYNFDNPDQPQSISMPPGKGKKLKKDMEILVDRLKEAIPKVFHEEDFNEKRNEINKKYQKKINEDTERLNKLAKDKGFEVSSGPRGKILLMPLIDGKKLENREALEKLPEEEKKRIEKGEEELTKELNQIMREQHEILNKLNEEVVQIERRFGEDVVKPMIDSLKWAYRDTEKVVRYLEKVSENILNNLLDFEEKSDKNTPQQKMFAMLGDSEIKTLFLEYKVNVLVDHSHSEKAPVIIEDTPTYRNLFGNIDRSVDQKGRLTTNFTHIKAGSLLRANGGYLVFNIEDALTEPLVYKNLKRTLKSGRLELETYNPWMLFTAGGLRPEAIPVNTKVVVVGSPRTYYLLRFFDDEFSTIFRVRADFGTEMNRRENEEMLYARFIATMVKREKLLHFTRAAIEEIIRFSSRKSGRKNKLYIRFSEVADLLREANYFALFRKAKIIDAEHIEEALSNRIFRNNRVEEKIQELIDDGTILVETSGSRTGQVNGIGVWDLGDYAFGKPSKVTTSVSLGSEGVMNIEREAKMSGKTHDKGVLILSGYLRNKYGRDKPLALSASICFEQSYTGVEGDSASAAELFALLSNLAEVPIKQNIAVTGSVNQWGEIQAIGAVNEKIEGFYDVCKTLGLTGRQGICIPESNIQNLMLRKDVREAVKEGKFNIYPIKTIDEGLELLTGFKSGEINIEGTLHHLVNERLFDMAKALRQFGYSRESSVIVSEEGAKPVGPPSTPDDQP